MGNCGTKVDAEGNPIHKEKALPTSKANVRMSEIHESVSGQRRNSVMVESIIPPSGGILACLVCRP